MAATYTQAYLLGIREGRAMLKQFAADGLANVATYRAVVANLKATSGLSGEAAEFRNGEVAFWRGQIGKAAA